MFENIQSLVDKMEEYIEEAKGNLSAIGGFFPRIFVLSHRVSVIEVEDLEEIGTLMHSCAEGEGVKAIGLVFNVLTNSYSKDEEIPEEEDQGTPTIGVWVYMPNKEFCRQIVFHKSSDTDFWFGDMGWEESEYSTEYLANPFKKESLTQ